MPYDKYNDVSYRYYFLDHKLGDVTGDGVIDRVYLVGEKTCSSDLFSENISIVIHDGRTNRFIRINMENADGYNAKLFLGHFTCKSKKDILVKIDTGGSGGYILAYLHSIIEGSIALLLDSESFEKISSYDVNFLDDFNVDVKSKDDDSRFILNTQYNKDIYIKNGIYDEDGKLKRTYSGSVLSLDSISPVIDDFHGLYKLSVSQRIIGSDIDDTIGLIQTLLKWNGKFMEIEKVNAVIPILNKTPKHT